ncbi:g5190 [Coccomyxa elongata]
MVNKRLIIAVDDSKECLKALDFAHEHFPTGYTYYLVHMQPRPLSYPYIASAVATESAYEHLHAMEKEMAAASHLFMEEVFAPKARSTGAEVCVAVVMVDSDSSRHIGAAICKLAEKAKADALIMMRQNKSAVAHFFLGSVTQYCAAHSPTPVIIVPNSV